MAVHLIVRITPWAPAKVRHSRVLTQLWLGLGALAAILFLLAGLGCTSGGGSPSTAAITSSPATGGTANSLVQANGGAQMSGDTTLGNQGLLGEQMTLKASTSANGTLQNESGLYPPVPGQ